MVERGLSTRLSLSAGEQRFKRRSDNSPPMYIFRPAKCKSQVIANKLKAAAEIAIRLAA